MPSLFASAVPISRPPLVLSSNGNDHKDSSFIAKTKWCYGKYSTILFLVQSFLRSESFRSPSSCSSFSGVIGQERIQTPQASWMAMPMAGAAPLQAISEMDFAPKGTEVVVDVDQHGLEILGRFADHRRAVVREVRVDAPSFISSYRV